MGLVVYGLPRKTKRTSLMNLLAQRSSRYEQRASGRSWRLKPYIRLATTLADIMNELAVHVAFSFHRC